MHHLCSFSFTFVKLFIKISDIFIFTKILANAGGDAVNWHFYDRHCRNVDVVLFLCHDIKSAYLQTGFEVEVAAEVSSSSLSL